MININLVWYARATLRFLIGSVVVVSVGSTAGAQTLQDQLRQEGVAALARAAKTEGDAARGALVFYQAHLSCAKCHVAPDAAQALGPDLAAARKDATPESLVESILEPSKVIKQGFEPHTVETRDGRTLSGMLVRNTDAGLTLRVLGADLQSITIPKADIVEHVRGKVSLMPPDQANQLANRQQFLDLARYLIEIAEGGPARQRQLQPPASLLVFSVPAYEKQVDHAGLIRDLNPDNYKRGEAIYQRLCINCHGTATQAGSLPTSLKFSAGKFKNGSDPFRMYQTLTYGYGVMAPQTWMVPQQKYDVIHYIRETYLKPLNPSQYAVIDAAYLKRLPVGTTRGPAPSKIEPWATMNYGSFLTATYEIPEIKGSGLFVPSPGRTLSPETKSPDPFIPTSNLAYKGIAVRLDSGPGGVAHGKYWTVFDHDTLRMAGAWSRAEGSDEPVFIDWNGINFNGRHQIHPSVSGDVEFSTHPGPGWAEPDTASWTDPRVLGRDGRRYGPLPKSWGRYRGLYQHGEKVILSYSIGQTDILEMPGVAVRGPRPVLTRTFNIGPRTKELILNVAAHPNPKAQLRGHMLVPVFDKSAPRELVQVGLSSAGTIEVTRNASEDPVRFDGATRIDIGEPGDFDLMSADYSITCRVRTKGSGTLFSQTEETGPWSPNAKALFIRNGKLCFDMGWVGVVTSKKSVNDGEWHAVAMTWTKDSAQVRLYLDGRLDATGVLKPKEALAKPAIRLGYAASDFPEPSYLQGEVESLAFYQRKLSDAELAKQDLKGGSVDVAQGYLARWEFKPISKESKDGIETVSNRARLRNVGHVIRQRSRSDRFTSDLWAGISGTVPSKMLWKHDARRGLQLVIPPGTDLLRFTTSIVQLPAGGSSETVHQEAGLNSQPVEDLSAFTKGGPPRWPEVLTTEVRRGSDAGPFAADILTDPTDNPWFCQMRWTGLDFYPDGDRMAICSWDGDVWLVSGLKQLDQTPVTAKPKLTWKRIATGLFQPLGLLLVEGQIHVTCRDQLVILRDLNNDGETDFLECINNDHQVTEHFHEFAMGLQRDAAGNFYYAKSARHALPALVPHHGTLLRISPDGQRTDILAKGFRAANGVCLNDDGTFFVTDQEGHWNPKNRINWVREGGFYGNMFGYHDVTDSSDAAMDPPLCWITNTFDRSPAELLWVRSDRWGPLRGALLNLSYGTGKIFVVPHEKRGTIMQGGMSELPLPAFPTGIMRGRFHPLDGQLYVCGMFSWAGNAVQPGGIYRVRYTGKPVHVPLGLVASPDGLKVTLSGEVDPQSVADVKNYTVQTWSLRRTANYGSNHHDEKTLTVKSARLSPDRKSISLAIPDIQPAWCMELRYTLKSPTGEPVEGRINNTIHVLK